MSQPERREFQAEVKQLLDLMIHSLYSNKEVFLRELLSNASDAIDKLRFEQVTQPELVTSAEAGIVLKIDAATRELSISDNGIGMSRDEVTRNIGTIAKSGTKEFLKAVQANRSGQLTPDLIGQFGVGFYSAFMVADKVTLLTRRAGESTATLWSSTGDGSYEIADAARASHGTTVTLTLKAADAEQGMKDFATEHTIRDLVKRYSDFVAYPIRLGEEETPLNSMKAIWDRPKSEVTEEEYNEFYRHISHDWTAPLRTIPVKMEGTIEAYALMYVPKRAPFDLYSAEMKRGLQLYVKRIFVMDECKDLLPSYLRFIKGVVDAHDLSLNVSREILQQDRQIQVIRKQLVKKVLATLEETKRDHWEDYLAFWGEFGAVLKEGLLSFEQGEREKLQELVLAASTAGAEPVALATYVERMKEGQEAIYVLTGARETIGKSPLLEAFTAKGYEVLLFSDAVDDMWLDRVTTYKDKAVVHIGRGDIALGTEQERKDQAAAAEEKQREMNDLLTCLRVHLQETIKEVRVSNRLTSSAVCLVTDDKEMTPRMARLLEQMGQTAPKQQHILEVNAGHPLMPKLQKLFEANSQDPRLRLYAEILLGQAHLADSGQLPDPVAFNAALSDVLVGAV